MKKFLNITATFLLAVHIWMRFYAPINRLALILKHISLFLLIGISAYLFTTFIFNSLYKKYQPSGSKENLLIIVRVLSFGLVIILFGVFQLDYIEFSETPYIEGCQYYDSYNNLIYESKFYKSCPELNIITDTDDLLEFSVEEYTNDKEAAILSVSEKPLSWNDQFEMTVLTNLSISYNSQSEIESIDYKVSYIGIIRGEDDSMYYYSRHKVIENDLTTGFTSLIKEAEIEVKYYRVQYLELTHYNFRESQYSSALYYIDVQDSHFEESDTYYLNTSTYTLMKDYLIDDTDPISVSIAEIEYVNENHQIQYEVNPNYSVNELIQHVLRDRHIGYKFSDDYIEYDVSSVYGNAKYRLQNKYELSNQNILTQSNIFIESSALGLSTDRISDFNKIKQGGKTYFYAENVPAPTLFETKSDRLYALQKTEYGLKVETLSYHSRHYINYLFNGQESNNENYYEDFVYVERFNFYKHFNLEYEIKEMKQSYNIVFKEPIYFIGD